MSKPGNTAPRCPACDKSHRAKLYCRRGDCGLLPGAMRGASAPAHVRYNAALAELKGLAHWADELAASAYGVALIEASPGPRNALLRLADVLSEAAALVRAAKPL